MDFLNFLTGASHVWEGRLPHALPMFNIRGNQIFKFHSRYNIPLLTFSGNQVFSGSTTCGQPLATIDRNGEVHKGGSTKGKVIYTIW